MLELSKKILVRVSFDQQLFHKELNKAINWMKDSQDIKLFREWCLIEFGHIYPSIIKKAFQLK